MVVPAQIAEEAVYCTFIPVQSGARVAVRGPVQLFRLDLLVIG